MSDVVEQLANEYGLFLCVGCGKCVAVCPMGEIFQDFTYRVSPRGVVERAVLGIETLEHEGVWFCLTCDLCTDRCPAGVRIRDFVQAVRQTIIEAGGTEHACFCRHCGVYIWPQHTVEYMKQTLKVSEESLTLCPRCRQHDFGKKMKALVPGSRQVHTQKIQAGESQ